MKNAHLLQATYFKDSVEKFDWPLINDRNILNSRRSSAISHVELKVIGFFLQCKLNSILLIDQISVVDGDFFRACFRIEYQAVSFFI